MTKDYDCLDLHVIVENSMLFLVAHQELVCISGGEVLEVKQAMRVILADQLYEPERYGINNILA